VDAIVLTEGFTQRNESRDLFTANHRVAAVQILHDGQKVSEHPIDPERRDLQRIPLDLTGGRLRIEVAGTLPGSVRRWREVCLSEIRVLGRSRGAPHADLDVVLGLEPGSPSLSEVSAARARLRSEPGAIDSGEQWWDAAQAALVAYPQRCALPHRAERIERAVEAVLTHEASIRAAQDESDDLACPGPGNDATAARRNALKERVEL